IIPPSNRERELARSVEPQVQQLAQGAADTAREAGEHLAPKVQEEARAVKEEATGAASEVAGHARTEMSSAKGDIRSATTRADPRGRRTRGAPAHPAGAPLRAWHATYRWAGPRGLGRGLERRSCRAGHLTCRGASPAPYDSPDHTPDRRPTARGPHRAPRLRA